MDAEGMSVLRWFAVALVFGTAASLVGVAYGDWWLAFPAGVAIGLLMARPGVAIAAGALSGLLGWSLPMAFMNYRYGLGPAAESLAAIMGFSKTQSAVPIILSCAVGLLLGLTGAWLGSAIHFIPFPAWRFGARRPPGLPDPNSEVW
jgi:hypothetical protein